MRRLVRNKTTRAFFVQGEWTNDVNSAQVFADVREIHKAKLDFNLSDIELYYNFGDAPNVNYDFTLPIF